MLWSSDLKNHANYIIWVPQYFFNFNLVQKFIFVIFWPLIKKGERKRGCQIPAIKRKTCRWHRFRLLKWIIFVSKYFIWLWKFILGVFFFTFKVHEKTNLNPGWFLVSGWVFFGWFFKIIDRFIMVLKVFWIKKLEL